MYGGYAHPKYDSIIGLGKHAEVDGFDIDGRIMPSDKFYTGKNGPVVTTNLADVYRYPTMDEIEKDKKELCRLYRQGEISKEQYQWELDSLDRLLGSTGAESV